MPLSPFLARASALFPSQQGVYPSTLLPPVAGSTKSYVSLPFSSASALFPSQGVWGISSPRLCPTTEGPNRATRSIHESPARSDSNRVHSLVAGRRPLSAGTGRWSLVAGRWPLSPGTGRWSPTTGHSPQPPVAGRRPLATLLSAPSRRQPRAPAFSSAGETAT